MSPSDWLIDVQNKSNDFLADYDLLSLAFVGVEKQEIKMVSHQ